MNRRERLWILFERQHGRCAYCKTLLISAWHQDHIVPRSAGGSHGLDNLCLACPRCNARKGCMPATRYQELLRHEAKCR